MENVGTRLKNVRNLLKKSQEELANELKLTKQAVSNMETGKSYPSLATLDKLLRLYDINLNYLVSGVGDILVNKEKTLKALRQSLIEDVEKMLDSRGII